MKIRIIALLFGVILLLSACSRDSDTVIRAAGLIDGTVLPLKVKVAGKIDELLVCEGSEAEKEQLAVVVDDRQVKNQLAAVKINMKELAVKEKRLQRAVVQLRENRDYLAQKAARMRRLSAAQAVSGDRVERLELELKAAETELFDACKRIEELRIMREKVINRREGLLLALEDHRIRIPVSGLVMETYVSAGENVFPGMLLADILDISSLYVEVFLEEDEISRLKTGGAAEIFVDGRPAARPLRGKITYFGRKAEFSPKYIVSEQERKNLLFQVKVTVIDDDALSLKVGMPVTVKFVVKQ